MMFHSGAPSFFSSPFSLITRFWASRAVLITRKSPAPPAEMISQLHYTLHVTHDAV